jgi:hypothetical protein
VIAAPGSLRFSSPDYVSIENVERDLLEALGDDRTFDRRSTPLPLALLDTAVWLFRLPDGMDEPTRLHLTREAVERYFEDYWIKLRRHGLGDLLDDDGPSEPPIYAAWVAVGQFEAKPGDAAIARAKLAAVIRIREQLSARPRVAGLYCGYPFDRLRRRLGLAPIDPDSFDPDDASCMSDDELRRLDPATLDDGALAEAYRSALTFHKTDILGPLALAIVKRDPSALFRSDLPAIDHYGASWSLDRHGCERALAWLDRALAIDAESNAGGRRESIEALRATILDRADHREMMARKMISYIDREEFEPSRVLAVARTMSEDRTRFARDVIRDLLEHAIDLAHQSGDSTTEDEARARLAALSDEESP